MWAIARIGARGAQRHLDPVAAQREGFAIPVPTRAHALDGAELLVNPLSIARSLRQKQNKPGPPASPHVSNKKNDILMNPIRYNTMGLLDMNNIL